MEHPLVARSVGRSTRALSNVSISSSFFSRSSVSLNQMLIHLFIRSFRLLTHCAKVHSGKRTKLSQRRGEKKRGKEVGWVRVGKKERECDVCARYWHSVRFQSKETYNITYERMTANFRSSNFAANMYFVDSVDSKDRTRDCAPPCPQSTNDFPPPSLPLTGAT